MSCFLNKSISKITLLIFGMSGAVFGTICQNVQKETDGVYVCDKITVSDEETNIPEDAKYLKVYWGEHLAIVAECSNEELNGIVRQENPPSSDKCTYQRVSYYRADVEYSRVFKNCNYVIPRYEYRSSRNYGLLVSIIEKDGNFWKVKSLEYSDGALSGWNDEWFIHPEKCKHEADKLCYDDILLSIDGKKVQDSFSEVYRLLMGEIGSVATVQVRRQIDGKNETKEINAKRAVAWEMDSLKRFYDDGSVRSRMIYPSPTSDSSLQENWFYESGNLKAITPYTHKYGTNAVEVGVEKGFYDSGELKYTLPLIKGKRDGLGKQFYQRGSLLFETPYKNDMREGIEKQYYENGVLNWETPFKYGKVSGIQKGYYSSGKLYRTNTYKDGVMDGFSKVYFENGKLAGSGKFRKGELVGYFKCTDGRVGTEKIDCTEGY